MRKSLSESVSNASEIDLTVTDFLKYSHFQNASGLVPLSFPSVYMNLCEKKIYWLKHLVTSEPCGFALTVSTVKQHLGLTLI